MTFFYALFSLTLLQIKSHTMKKIFAIILAFSLVTSIQAQSDSRYKLSALQLSHGANVDVYGSQMSLDWMKARTVSEQPFQIDFGAFDEYVWTGSAGYTVSGQMVFAPSNKKGPELRIGVGATLGKESLIDYTDAQTPYSYSDFMYCFLENEVGGSAELIWRKSSTRFSAYAGLGASAMVGLNNKLYFFQNYFYSGRPGYSEFSNSPNGIDNEFKGYSTIYSRAYAPLGVSVKVFRHLELTFEQRLGMGVDAVTNWNDINLLFNSATTFGLRYNLERYKGRNETSLFQHFLTLVNF